MKTFLKRLLLIMCRFVTINKNSILIIESSYPSGSNTKILFETIKDQFNVEHIDSNKIFFERNSFKDYLKYIKMMLTVSKFKIIITTHGFIKYNPNQIVIDLWHGIPMKAMAYMENNENVHPNENFNTDFLITNSKLDSVLMSSCVHLPFTKHKILGSPRNDYLYQEREVSSFNFEAYRKIILFMPTFRQGYQNRIEGTISEDLIPVKDFDINRFNQYLEENNYLFLIKLHPLEEDIAIKKIGRNNGYVKLITNNDLLHEELDIYEMLPHVDLLVTDYSSVYLDYLLLNRPVVFVNHDLKQYEDSRGFLLEPYDYWTPGFKTNTYDRFIYAIDRSFSEDPFREKRLELSSLFHKHHDGHSTERVVDLLEKLLKK